MEYHGEVRSVAENSISLILSDNPQLNGSETCKVQVTVDNVLYCWDQAQIQADTASGSHAYVLQLPHVRKSKPPEIPTGRCVQSMYHHAERFRHNVLRSA